MSYRGKHVQSLPVGVRAEDIAKGIFFSLENSTFKDPDFYIAGNLHKHILEWESLGASEEVLNWLKHGVDVNNYFKHFKVKAYDSDLPPPIFQNNASSCKGLKKIIAKTLFERVKNGSISLWGKVGETQPPFVVMPLTVEP